MLNDIANIAGILSFFVSAFAVYQSLTNKDEIKALKKLYVVHQTVGPDGKSVAQSVSGDKNIVAGGDIN